MHWRKLLYVPLLYQGWKLTGSMLDFYLNVGGMFGNIKSATLEQQVYLNTLVSIAGFTMFLMYVSVRLYIMAWRIVESFIHGKSKEDR